MNNSNLSFGPWSSALDAANTSPLSRFWKRRLSFLSHGAECRPGISKLGKGILLVISAIAFGLPALSHVATAPLTAQEQTQQTVAGDSAEPAAKQAVDVGEEASFSLNATGTEIAKPRIEFLPRPSVQEARLYEALHENTTLELVAQPLTDSLQFLMDYHGEGLPEQAISIQIDHKALEEAGLTSDVPITYRARNLRLESALRLMLAQHNLTFLVIDDVLKVTTRDAAAETLMVRTYLVGDLVEDDYDSLIDTITSTIDPSSWDDVGGLGSISVVPSALSLVVRQNFENHNSILELIRNLREARSIAGPTDATNSGRFGRRSQGGFGGGGFGGQGGVGGLGFGAGEGGVGGFGGGSRATKSHADPKPDEKRSTDGEGQPDRDSGRRE